MFNKFATSEDHNCTASQQCLYCSNDGATHSYSGTLLFSKCSYNHIRFSTTVFMCLHRFYARFRLLDAA